MSTAHLSFVVLFFIGGAISVSIDVLHRPIAPCHIGDVVANDWNHCICTSKSIIECTSLKTNKKAQEINKADFHKQVSCYPNQIYVKRLVTCICNKNGTWPHRACYEDFNILPPANIVRHKCTPNTYIRIDCNICRCGSDGEIKRCTKNTCREQSLRRIDKTSRVYSKCDINSWYSLAPCQFCYCTRKDRLVCNTGNNYSTKFEVGSYNLMSCGKEFIKEALELVPESEQYMNLKQDPSENNIFEYIEITSNSTDEKEVLVNENVNEETANNRAAKETTTSLPTTKKVLRIGTVMIPYQEDSDITVEVSSSEDQMDLTRLTKPASEETQQKESPAQETQPKDTQKSAKFNISNILNQLFAKSLRRLVTMKNKSCEPGSSVTMGCNTCFCLVNNKLLCTDKKCA